MSFAKNAKATPASLRALAAALGFSAQHWNNLWKGLNPNGAGTALLGWLDSYI
jgi:hypothetical protein